jgi:putative ubiquitin-RnfH superfamily antitoxin RatB of RatAB toxin-antitoxin module
MAGADIGIEVACALPERQLLLALTVPAGTTLLQAVARSRILEQFPALAPATLCYGVFGKREKKPEERVLQDGDRVEIYRPLLIDPVEARRARAARARAARPHKA